jgi:hypothetical protein
MLKCRDQLMRFSGISDLLYPFLPLHLNKGESPKVVERHVLLSDQRQGHKFLLIAFLRAEMVVFIIPGNQMCAIMAPCHSPV